MAAVLSLSASGDQLLSYVVLVLTSILVGWLVRLLPRTAPSRSSGQWRHASPPFAPSWGWLWAAGPQLEGWRAKGWQAAWRSCALLPSPPRCRPLPPSFPASL